MSDEELKDMAALELEDLKTRLEAVTKELEILLVPKDENDGKNIIMEIRGAAGGDEANIFAGDLYRMYTYYAEKMVGELKNFTQSKELVVGILKLKL